MQRLKSMLFACPMPTRSFGADRVVFPGVGAIRDCMQALNQSGLSDVIQQVAKTKPLLGICLGMQALLTDSEENGGTQCLDVFAGHVVRFPESLERQRRQFAQNSAHGLESGPSTATTSAMGKYSPRQPLLFCPQLLCAAG